MPINENGSLASLLGMEEEGISSYKFQPANIPLDWINKLPQPRQTFEGIVELAENIVLRGLRHSIEIAQFNRANCEDYIKIINLLWGTSFDVSQLISVRENQEEIFHILLAGERRYRACSYLMTVGCEECRRDYNEKGCYERHFGKLTVRVNLCVNISPMEALFIQASENIHMRVPAHEEARFYYEFLSLIRKIKPDYPINRFAQQVGRNPETIRAAVKFCLLPDEIQEFVKSGQISYGIACELARISSQTEADAELLKWWALRAVIGNYRVPDFREVVSAYLYNQNSGQVSLFSPKEQAELGNLHFRNIVGKQTIMGIWNFIHYFNRVLVLFSEGKLGKEDSSFSEKSPVRVFRRLIDVLEKLLPHIQSFLPNKEHERCKEVINDIRNTLKELD